MLNHPIWSLLFHARKVVFVMAMVGAIASSLGNELVSGGELGSLDAWDPPRLPASAGREIVEGNSPFVEVYPSNGKSLKLVDAADLVHQIYLSQQISTGTGKLVWSFDYKRLENDSDTRDGGFVVRLTSGGKSHTWVKIADDFSAHLTKGDLGVGTHQVKSTLLVRGIWYHFRGEIDLGDQTMAWTLTTEGGETFEFPKGKLMLEKDADPAMVDGLLIRANHGGGPNYSHPILFDNLSVQQLP